MQPRRGCSPVLCQGLCFLVLLLILLIGCSRSAQPAIQPPLLPSSPPQSPLSFPPQKVMQDDNYEAFLAENEDMLQQCEERTGCDVALFNLGFIYAYPRSPYRDLTAALWYFGELVNNYSDSPWAFQARAWTACINETRALEERQRQLRAHLSTREERIRILRQQLKASRQQLKASRQQLKASRQIDIEMDKKERELLR